MSTPKPGDFITAKCTRCNDVTGHVVMLVLDGLPAKVECRACGSVHKYRDGNKGNTTVKKQTAVRHVKAGQSREEGRTLSTGTRSSTSSSASRSGTPRQSRAAKLESAWQEAMLKHTGETPVPYSMRGTFEISTLLEHPTFGLGEILELTRPDKMTVLFEDGIKVLRCTVE